MVATYRCSKCKREFEDVVDPAEDTGRTNTVLRRCPGCGRSAVAGAWTAHPPGCLRVTRADSEPVELCSFDETKGVLRSREP